MQANGIISCLALVIAIVAAAASAAPYATSHAKLESAEPAPDALFVINDQQPAAQFQPLTDGSQPVISDKTQEEDRSDSQSQATAAGGMDTSAIDKDEVGLRAGDGGVLMKSKSGTIPSLMDHIALLSVHNRRHLHDNAPSPVASSVSSSRQRTLEASGEASKKLLIRKRVQCWDLKDVCCLWDICY